MATNKLISFSFLIISISGRQNELIEQDPKVIGDAIKTPQPYEYINMNDLPINYDLRSEGLLTTDLNQHIPVYCGRYFIIFIYFSSYSTCSNSFFIHFSVSFLQSLLSFSPFLT